MGPNFASLAAEFDHEAITLPASGSAVTLQSLLGAALKRKNRCCLGVKFTLMSADALWGITAAKCLMPIDSAVGFDEPIQGPAILNGFFSSANATPVTLQCLIYLGAPP
jgi:hypothetical protein